MSLRTMRDRALFIGILGVAAAILTIVVLVQQNQSEKALNQWVVSAIHEGRVTGRVADIHYKTVTKNVCTLGCFCQDVPAIATLHAFNTVEDEMLPRLLRLRDLQSLRLTDQGIHDGTYRKLRRLPAVTELQLISCDIDTGIIDNTSPPLTLLDLSGSTVTPPAIDGLMSRGTLVEFRAKRGSRRLVEDSLTALASRTPTLTTLNLSYADLTDTEAAILRRLPSLTTVHLDGTRITYATMHTLARLEQLAILRVSRTAITNEGLMAFAQSKTLQEIDVTGCDLISTDGLANFADSNSRAKIINLNRQ